MTPKEPAAYGTTLRRRIEVFYTDNPGEWLTWDDLCQKFDCTKDQARNAMQALRDDGRLEWEVVNVVRLTEQH